jgi:hypothetical protein
VLNYLSKEDIDYYIVTKQQHSALSIINRFIRTHLDYCKKNDPISNIKINNFIKNYNSTIPKTIGMSPNEMQNNKGLEVEYIIESINKQNKIEIQPGYKLSINDNVRLIEKKKELKKTRYNVTPYYFRITDIEGKQFTISAEDGSVKTVTRSQIIPVKNTELNIK